MIPSDPALNARRLNAKSHPLTWKQMLDARQVAPKGDFAAIKAGR